MTYLKIIRKSAENERSEEVHIYREQEKEFYWKFIENLEEILTKQM